MLLYRYKKHTDNIPMEDFDMKAKFYICNHCGNLVTTIHNAGVPLVCCGEKMKELQEPLHRYVSEAEGKLCGYCKEELCNSESGRMVVELYLGKQDGHGSRILY